MLMSFMHADQHVHLNVSSIFPAPGSQWQMLNHSLQTPDTITHWWSPMYHNTSPDNIEYCPCYLNIYSWTLNTNHLIMNDKLSFQVHISQLVIKTQTVMIIFPSILTTPLPLLTFNIDSQFELYCLKQIFLKLFQELFKKSSVTCINLSSWGLYWI